MLLFLCCGQERWKGLRERLEAFGSTYPLDLGKLVLVSKELPVSEYPGKPTAKALTLALQFDFLQASSWTKILGCPLPKRIMGM